MAKVLILSQVFPTYHPRAGQLTGFVHKFLSSLPSKKETAVLFGFDLGLIPKKHTIRSGNRFKPGDFFSPRIWLGKPYRSKQIKLVPDVEVLKTYKFEIINGIIYLNDIIVPHGIVKHIAMNDGLTMDDFYAWFQYPKPFSGQIIVWDESIKYESMGIYG
jgi:hypothetical protein